MSLWFRHKVQGIFFVIFSFLIPKFFEIKTFEGSKLGYLTCIWQSRMRKSTVISFSPFLFIFFMRSCPPFKGALYFFLKKKEKKEKKEKKKGSFIFYFILYYAHVTLAWNYSMFVHLSRENFVRHCGSKSNWWLFSLFLIS